MRATHSFNYPMKRLIILRHAKASWDDHNLNDFNRHLSKRGELNSVLMGKFINSKQGKPDLIITSSATRAYATAKIIAEQVGYTIDEIITNQELYLAWINDLLKTIAKLPHHIQTCLMVGHNPGLTDLINYFGVRLDYLPTASAVCFEFDTSEWSKISKENSNLEWYQFAKDL